MHILYANVVPIIEPFSIANRLPDAEFPDFGQPVMPLITIYTRYILVYPDRWLVFLNSHSRWLIAQHTHLEVEHNILQS